MTANSAAMNAADAEEYTQSLGQVFHGVSETVEGGWRLIASGIKQGVPEALGLSDQEWADSLMPLRKYAIEERREMVAELAADGLNQREIAAVVGVGKSTVNDDLRVQNRTSSEENDSRNADSIITSVQNRTNEVEEGDDNWWDDGSPEPMPTTGWEPSPVRPHVAQNSGDFEWYTPAEYITAARSVLGEIDLDPASSQEANDVVGARRYYTVDDDGLEQPWSGRVWMNPPYAKTAVDRFCTRLAREYREGTVSEAVALVNNATETTWFQEMAATASALCFPRGRVKFWHPSKESAPLQGQALVYLGPNPKTFRGAFVRFGFVVGHGDEVL